MTMLDPSEVDLPIIPGKRYFTIGEVSELCFVKPHVLRYWEQEFPQLRPVKRRGNRRYYRRHEVELIRAIRALLYLEGYTISGARNQLQKGGASRPHPRGPQTEQLGNCAEILEELKSIPLLLDC